jgi:decaprenylphospho-beta-D-ribofuranose 2-oxidase
MAAARLDFVTHRRRFHFGSAHETLKNWNRLFGRRGFVEYHYCVPDAALEESFRALLGMRKSYGAHLFFAAGKRFGAHARAGMISFPAEGWGINFQVPNSGRHRRLLADFTDALAELGGRVYLAKDSVVTPRQLERMYARLPEWRGVLGRYDPGKRIQSDLSRRLELKPW